MPLCVLPVLANMLTRCCDAQETQKGDITLALDWMPVELDD